MGAPNELTPCAAATPVPGAEMRRRVGPGSRRRLNPRVATRARSEGPHAQRGDRAWRVGCATDTSRQPYRIRPEEVAAHEPPALRRLRRKCARLARAATRWQGFLRSGMISLPRGPL